MVQFFLLGFAACFALSFGVFFFFVVENRRPAFLSDYTQNQPNPFHGNEDDDDEDDRWDTDWNDVEIDLPPGGGYARILPQEIPEAEQKRPSKALQKTFNHA